VVDQVEVGPVQGRDERERKVGGTLPAGIEVRPHLGPPMFSGLPLEVLQLVGAHVPGETERLKPLEPGLGLYAVDVALPLFALDRVASEEHAACPEERVEVGVGPPVHGRPRGLHGLIEADVVLLLYRRPHVVPGQPREHEREQEHGVGRRRGAHVAKHQSGPGPHGPRMSPEPAYESPRPSKYARQGAPAIDNAALTAPRTFPLDKRCPSISSGTHRMWEC
jgi:hypothetical protein